MTIEFKKQSVFVNVYLDDKGRFLGDHEYETYQEAFSNRDDLSTYVETVEIIRYISLEQKVY